jgi:endoglucanase
MKKNRLVAVMISVWAISLMSAQSPFSKGVNLTNWFQTGNVKQIQFTKYTFKDFQNIKNLGCDVIRLPINLHAMTSGKPDYKVDPMFYTFLDSAVSWAETLGINLIIDNHTFDPAVSTDANVGPILVTVWKQMATHYKNTSTKIFYEVLNEPHGITDDVWGQIQKTVIDAIREVDTKHTIVVGPGNWNGYNSLKNLPVYTDANLIYTFHFYDPFLFTHQGASWTDPSMTSLAGVPFPYDAGKMPACPANLKGTWVESSISTAYKTDGTIEKVKSLIDIAITFQKSRNVKVFCGEFGVYNMSSNDSDRVFWYKTVCDYLNSNGIPWTIWDYQGAFGLFKKGTNQRFQYDLNVPLLKGLNLNIPEQKKYVMLPDSIGFSMYSDYISENVFESSNAGTSIIDFYSASSPNNGKYDIYWKVGAQYNSVGFDLSPDKDLSLLLKNGYALDLIVRGTDPGAKLDLRFIDTKTTDAADHPWRIKYTLDNSVIPMDGYWHVLHVPLKSFVEQGSWDVDTWYNPAGLFDWKAVDRFEFAAEYTESVGKYFWFDNFTITNQDTSVIYDKSKYVIPSKVSDSYNDFTVSAFPIPMGDAITIKFYLSAPQYIKLSIYNMMGQKVKTFIDSYKEADSYSYVWYGDDENKMKVSNGVYFCTIKTSSKSETIKVIKK